MMDETTMIYLALTLVVLLLAFGTIGSIAKGIYYDIAILLIIITAGLIVIISQVDYVMFTMLTSLLGTTIKPANNYMINKKQDSIVKNVNNLYYATGYVTANLFPYVFKNENPPEDEEDRMSQAPELWENIVRSLGFPFKFHVFSIGLNVQASRDELEGKRSYQEFQLSRALQGNANETVITSLQRQIRILQSKIDMISSGEKPIATIMYIETTAVGITDQEALDKLSSQVTAIQVAFSSFDVELRRIVGRELYEIFKFNFALPLTVKDASRLFDQQG
ncbi:membrane protein [Candidatus Mancarchaeum acidiphilum]|uniref:Membrane protein n=1 Tax=Candidatus Mancarchaeum acidiphilum TaxID=1920749 RepID=A0A218NNI7_9ARCH|nr:hypothetical protein [Candidatus Mancarchaeum acidiphilum]ASI14035.1 membrane protein [Candidatus Mancarchaeum acidiphilum]